MEGYVIKVNDEWLPNPVEDLKYNADKIKNETESEAGITLVLVTRVARLSISGKWQLTGAWMSKFRQYRDADTVMVKVYYPSTEQLSEYECQFEIAAERHLTKARKQMDVGGLYEVDVNIKEL